MVCSYAINLQGREKFVRKSSIRANNISWQSFDSSYFLKIVQLEIIQCNNYKVKFNEHIQQNYRKHVGPEYSF